jgi:LysM repeat protein
VGISSNPRPLNQHRKLNFHFLIRIAGILLLCCPAFLQAQEIKKTARVEKVGDVKYYIHTVEPGQTLFAIAKAYYVEVNEIVVENPTAIDGIKPGQELRIPYLKSLKNGYDKNKPQTHKTEAGQTLYSISKLYGITVEDLKSANPELKDGLKAGQVLRIPGPTKTITSTGKTPPVQTAAERTGPEQTRIIPKSQVKEEMKGPAAKAPGGVTELAVPADTLFNLVKKEKYKVALFAPFHGELAESMDADHLSRDQNPFSAKLEMAVQFYQGFRLAMDSLKRTGLAVELFMYDLDDNDSARIQETLRKPELKEMNLIIGPLSGACFSTVAKFAHKNNISIVSPLSQQNKVLLNNDCVSKMIPSVTTQLEEEAAFITKNCKGQNVVLVSNSSSKEMQYVNIFRTRYNELLKASGSGDSLIHVKASEGISKVLSLTKVNVVILPSNSQAYVTDILRNLNTLLDKYQIVVYGMQSWTAFANLDYDYLDKLHLHYTVNSFVEYENDNTLNFIKNFRILASTEPGTYAFEGYDAGLFYLTALREYGINFRKRLPKMKWTGVQNSFDLYKTSPESGFENKAVNMVMIQDFKLIRATK